LSYAPLDENFNCGSAIEKPSTRTFPRERRLQAGQNQSTTSYWLRLSSEGSQVLAYGSSLENDLAISL
jgi:hypothetical protein